MFKSLRRQVALPYVLLIVSLSVVLTLVLTQLSRRVYLDDLDARLRSEAALLAADLAEYSSPDQVAARVRSLGRSIDPRITVVEADGRVIADSVDDPAMLPDQGGQPEIAEAIATGIGRAERHSDRVGYRTRYVAMPVGSGNGGPARVVRVGFPLREIDARVQSMSRIALLAGGIVAAVSGLAGVLIAARVTRPIVEMTSVAKDMAAGDLDRRVRVDSKGEIGELALAFNLMSERLAATLSRVREESATMAAVLSTMDDAVGVISSQGVLLLMNDAATRLFATQREAALGRRFIEICLDHEMNTAVQQCIRTQMPQTAIIERPNDRRVLRLVATPVQAVEGGGTGALLIIQDLTELRRLEMVRRDFIANVSHELRTPLSAVKAIVETLEDGALSDVEAAQDFLAKMHDEVDHMAVMVQELLDLSRIESGESAPVLRAVEVSGLLNEAVERLRPAAERAGVELHLSDPSGLPPVMADSVRIGRVLTNLIHNATKFTPPGGKITVGATSSDGWVTITVADTGTGISREDLPRIFERFYKADASRSGLPQRQASSGTGLGLAIAKHIVQSHNGEIWAESRPGEGARFSFTLPVAAASPAQPLPMSRSR